MSEYIVKLQTSSIICILDPFTTYTFAYYEYIKFIVDILIRVTLTSRGLYRVLWCQIHAQPFLSKIPPHRSWWVFERLSNVFIDFFLLPLFHNEANLLLIQWLLFSLPFDWLIGWDIKAGLFLMLWASFFPVQTFFARQNWVRYDPVFVPKLSEGFYCTSIPLPWSFSPKKGLRSPKMCTRSLSGLLCPNVTKRETENIIIGITC